MFAGAVADGEFGEADGLRRFEQNFGDGGGLGGARFHFLKKGLQAGFVAFEPNPRNLIYLRRHVTLNDCANVRVIAAAVADVAGHAAFQDGTRDAEGLLAAGGTLDVETVTLDAIAYGTPGLPPPSVLKIDVEGAEQRVLAGAERLLAEAKPDILLSTHGRDNYVGCQTTLARHGYHVRQMSAATKGTELLATARGS